MHIPAPHALPELILLLELQAAPNAQLAHTLDPKLQLALPVPLVSSQMLEQHPAQLVEMVLIQPLAQPHALTALLVPLPTKAHPDATNAHLDLTLERKPQGAYSATLELSRVQVPHPAPLALLVPTRIQSGLRLALPVRLVHTPLVLDPSTALGAQQEHSARSPAPPLPPHVLLALLEVSIQTKARLHANFVAPEPSGASLAASPTATAARAAWVHITPALVPHHAFPVPQTRTLKAPVPACA